jgi:hypothetical protein
MEFTFRPLGLWPGELTKSRKRSPFRAGYNDTLILLDKELRHLGARSVVLQVALPADKIRLDGRPYSTATPSHPGIILAFDSKHGPLSYPCDRFDDWQDNLRAIALGLQALRAVDRYGVTRRAEQYKGWTALPNPHKAAGPMTVDEALAFLRAHAPGVSLGCMDERRAAYRIAAGKLHPDRNPGDDNALNGFKRLQEAKEVLGL